ncbi:MAG: FtsW/RodA/SpoVE family cell cycle protein [Anaerolineaceae bacterium]
MGERTSMNATPNTASRKNFITKLPFDVPLLLIVTSLLVFGLLMVYSSSWDASLRIGEAPTYVFTRQVLWVVLGIALAVGLSFFDYHKFERYVIWMMAAVIILLIVVLIRNDVRFNSTRSLVSGSIQPAELAKLCIILYLSFWLSKRKDNLKDVSVGLLPLSVILGLVAGFIFVQPDISAAATIVLLGVLLFFLAGGDWKQLLVVGVVGLVVGGAVVAATSTGKIRLEEYFNGLQNPIMGSYHIQRTFEAIIKGRFFGVGIGQADTKFTGLPLPHTDSIFAVIAEETGLFGAFIVVALYVLMLWRGLTIAKRAPDQLGALMSFGLIGWIVIEALMNFAVIVGLFPFTGNALPLISAGGSSMLTSMAAIGITMNIARQGVTKESGERRQTSAIVDLRGRDRWRSVSGTNRYEDPQD